MATTELIGEEQELKTDLIRSLEHVHDIRFLRGQLAMVREYTAESDEDVYEPTPEEEKMIDEGIAELDAGLGISGKEVEKKANEWLRNYKKTAR